MNTLHTMSKTMGIIFVLLCGVTAIQGQLVIRVSPPLIAARKVVVTLSLTNGLTEKVESARAAVFILDEQGKMVGQATRWIVGGGQDRLGLEPGATNIFNVVIASDKPFATTNLTSKVTVTRVVLDGGKLADLSRSVTIMEPKK